MSGVDETEPQQKRRREEEEHQERAEAVFLIFWIVVNDSGTKIYRVPANELVDEQLAILEEWNNSNDQNRGDEAEAVRNMHKYLTTIGKGFERKPALGQSAKKPKDVVLDVFTFWTVA
jgi:hypothetical protein